MCGAKRDIGQTGFCSSTDVMRISRAAPHIWEEPIISGTGGSGTIFFCGCSLGCVFCQNAQISRGDGGKEVTVERLADIMLELKEKGVHNINFVTPTHYAPSIKYAVEIARNDGLSIPIVYNTGTYDRLETIAALRGTVDIYLPDYKYYRTKTAAEYSKAPDYPELAFCAIREMVRQKPNPVITNGLMREGVIVRLLLLPGHVAEAKLSLKRIYESFGNSVYISLMNQYTPMPNMKPPLDRKVTREEYRSFVSYAEKIGVVNGFVQDYGTANESFIPPFDYTGI